MHGTTRSTYSPGNACIWSRRRGYASGEGPGLARIVPPPRARQADQPWSASWTPPPAKDRSRTALQRRTPPRQKMPTQSLAGTEVHYGVGELARRRLPPCIPDSAKQGAAQRLEGTSPRHLRKV